MKKKTYDIRKRVIAFFLLSIMIIPFFLLFKKDVYAEETSATSSALEQEYFDKLDEKYAEFNSFNGTKASLAYYYYDKNEDLLGNTYTDDTSRYEKKGSIPWKSLDNASIAKLRTEWKNAETVFEAILKICDYDVDDFLDDYIEVAKGSSYSPDVEVTYMWQLVYKHLFDMLKDCEYINFNADQNTPGLIDQNGLASFVRPDLEDKIWDCYYDDSLWTPNMMPAYSFYKGHFPEENYIYVADIEHIILYHFFGGRIAANNLRWSPFMDSSYYFLGYNDTFPKANDDYTLLNACSFDSFKNLSTKGIEYLLSSKKPGEFSVASLQKGLKGRVALFYEIYIRAFRTPGLDKVIKAHPKLNKISMFANLSSVNCGFTSLDALMLDDVDRARGYVFAVVDENRTIHAYEAIPYLIDVYNKGYHRLNDVVIWSTEFYELKSKYLLTLHEEGILDEELTKTESSGASFGTIADMMIDDTANRTASTWQEAAELVSLYLLDNFRPNMKSFYAFFGITEGVDEANYNYISFFVKSGYILSFLLLLWNLFIMFNPCIQTKEGPVKLLFRFCLVAVGIYFAKDIMDWLFNFAGMFWDELISSNYDNPDLLTRRLYPAQQISNTFNVKINKLLSIILTLFAGIIVFKHFIQLILEIIERYVVACLLHICFPIAIAMGISESTTPIFKAYLRMIGSQLFLMIMNIWFVRMFFNLLEYGGTNFDGNVLYFFFTIAFLKTAQRLDSHIASLGLSVAQTGGNLLSACTSAVLMAGGALSLIKSGVKGGARLTGKGMSEAGIRTNSKGLMSAGNLMQRAGGNRRVDTSLSTASDRLNNARVERGLTPTVALNEKAWNKMTMGGMPSAKALSSDNLISGIRENIAGLNTNSMSSVMYDPRRNHFTGYSTVGKTASGQNIDAGFTLSRIASADATKYTDSSGNDWYLSYDKDKSINFQNGDMIAADSPNIQALTGINQTDLRRTLHENSSAIASYEKTSKGWTALGKDASYDSKGSLTRGFICGIAKSGAIITNQDDWFSKQKG